MSKLIDVVNKVYTSSMEYWWECFESICLIFQIYVNIYFPKDPGFLTADYKFEEILTCLSLNELPWIENFWNFFEETLIRMLWDCQSFSNLGLLSLVFRCLPILIAFVNEENKWSALSEELKSFLSNEDF